MSVDCLLEEPERDKYTGYAASLERSASPSEASLSPTNDTLGVEASDG